MTHFHQETAGHHPHRLHPHPAPHHHLPHDQLLQAILLWGCYIYILMSAYYVIWSIETLGCCHRQLDSDVGACHDVHLRLWKPAEDILHKDGRHLADLQFDDSILWGDTESTSCLMFWSLKVILHTYIDSLRVDEDREINHHGKSVKVWYCH